MNYYPKVNLHIHSKFSFDSELDPEFIVENSLLRNYNVISITDHLDFNPKDPAYGHYKYEDAENLNEMLNIKYNNIKIIFGVEVGYEKVRENEIKEYLNNKRFEIKIGSIHCMNDTIISDWMKSFADDEIEYAAGIYYEELNNLVLSGIFNIIGHFDYYKKYATNIEIAKHVWKKFHLKIEKIFREAVERNIIPEINTSGLRQQTGEPYPSEELLEIYKDVGGIYISIGSDAHKKEHLDYGIVEAETTIKKFGFKVLEF